MKVIQEEGKRRIKKNRHLDMMANTEPLPSAREAFRQPAFMYTALSPGQPGEGRKGGEHGEERYESASVPDGRHGVCAEDSKRAGH